MPRCGEARSVEELKQRVQTLRVVEERKTKNKKKTRLKRNTTIDSSFQKEKRGGNKNNPEKIDYPNTRSERNDRGEFNENSWKRTSLRKKTRRSSNIELNVT